MNVAVVTMWGERYKDVAEITVPVMKRYCLKHNYDFWEHKIENDNRYSYKKHEFFQKLFKTDTDVIFYLDADALITNSNFKVEDFIDEEHDLFVTEDPNGVNLGVLILKNNKTGQWLNEFILSQRDKFVVEQDVVNDLIKSPFFNHQFFIKILPHPSINSYPYEYYSEFPDMKHEDGNWREGDFVCHVPGLALDKRIEILKSIHTQ